MPLAQKYGWECYIVHLASGRVSAATVELAAQLIVDEHHREATSKEIAAHQTEQKLRSEEIAARARGLKRTNFNPNDGRTDPNSRSYRYE